MTALAAQWIVAFSAAVAASAVCWGAYSLHEFGREFKATVERNEARSQANRHAIRTSECVQVPVAPLADEESA